MNIPSSGLAVLGRSRAVGLILLRVPPAAHSPAGLPDRCAAGPTHPPVPYAHWLGSQLVISSLPGPWHRAPPAGF
eukprot:scaffold48501_cov50-Phaeocystis_antarctica.AAC.1